MRQKGATPTRTEYENQNQVWERGIEGRMGQRQQEWNARTRTNFENQNGERGNAGQRREEIRHKSGFEGGEGWTTHQVGAVEIAKYVTWATNDTRCQITRNVFAACIRAILSTK